MFRQSANPVLTRPFIDAILAALIDAAPLAILLDGAEVKLHTNAVAIGPDTTDPVAYTEADFDGYAEVAPAGWTGPSHGGDSGQYVHTQADFQAGGGLVAPGQEVRGYTVEVGGVVFMAENFPVPVNFNAVGKSLSLDVVIKLPFDLDSNVNPAA